MSLDAAIFFAGLALLAGVFAWLFIRADHEVRIEEAIAQAEREVAEDERRWEGWP